MLKYQAIPIIALILFFSLTYCQEVNEKSAQTKGKIKIESPSGKKTAKSVKYLYYKRLDEKNKKPVEPISESGAKQLKEHYQVGYSKKDQILLIKKYKKNKWFSSQYYEYNNRGSLIRKELKTRQTRLVHFFNAMGQVTAREKHVKIGKKYIKLEKHYLEPQGLVKQMDKFAEGKVVTRKKYDYYQDSDKVKQVNIFNQDPTLIGPNDVLLDENLFLHKKEFYRQDGKIEKEEFFDRELGKLGHWKKYIYNSDAEAVVEEFAQDNKLAKKWYYNKKGKLIKMDEYDKNGQLIKTDIPMVF